MVTLGFRKRSALLLCMLGLAGCSSDKPATTTEPAAPATAEERLTAIGKAYQKAASRLGKPPRSAEDIKDDVEGGFTPELLRSPNDYEPFVVLWGVDLNKLPKSGDTGRSSPTRSAARKASASSCATPCPWRRCPRRNSARRRWPR
jgi:hypothetical protein